MSNLNVFQRFVEKLIAQHEFDVKRLGTTLKLHHPTSLPLMLQVPHEGIIVVAHYLNGEENGEITLRESITVDVSAENWKPVALTEHVYPAWTLVTHTFLTEADEDPLDVGARPKRIYTNRCIRAHICDYAATWARSMEIRGWLDKTLVYAPIDYEYRVSDDSDERWPPYSGREFFAMHENIKEHAYWLAFREFLTLGLDADIANILAFGENRFDLISADWDNPLRQAAFKVYDRLAEAAYWADSE